QLCQDEDNNQSVDKIIAQLPSYQHLAIDNHLQSRYQQLEQTLENHPQIKRGNGKRRYESRASSTITV
ncbi:hypothetical protein, partial [Klebsiella pneumoniae]|uniref:hypothetical protein n=1 Tax=Klebsiella pneumoniae TaxID=573 RepID=UPI001D023ADA